MVFKIFCIIDYPTKSTKKLSGFKLE